MAAMASPLLEEGAIDGARGILINITGSSNLKLSEVNEASTIIQNAAHEDANIIFGAVMDERLGDELKLTVIATGFRNDEKRERRERMLSEPVLTIEPKPVVEPRIVAPPMAVPPVPRFASEVAAEQEQSRVVTTSVPTSSYYEAARQQARQEVAPTAQSATTVAMPEPAATPMSAPVHETRPPEVVERLPEPELIPVRASVFDDDFFREPKAVHTPPPVAPVPEPVIARAAEPIHIPEPEPQLEPVASFEDEETPTLWPEARVPSFAGYAGGDTVSSDSDELDIPAFLRKKH